MRTTSLLLACGLLLSESPPAFASILTVTNTNDSGAGSLRECFTVANNPGPIDRIVFAIPGTGPHTIQLLTPLPPLVNKTAIDGRTQSGYVSFPTIAGTPRIEISGTMIPGINGVGIQFEPTAGGSAVRGLAIGGFDARGVYVRQAAACTLAANHIGCNAAGTAARPNGEGVYAEGAASLRIGGLDLRSRNVISGNNYQGVYIQGGTEARLHLNLIGTTALGTTALPNGAEGILSVDATLTEIGDPTNGLGNVISANGASGVSLHNSTPINSGQAHGVWASLIGTDLYGHTALGNGGYGILLESPYARIGITTWGNVISANALGGIRVNGPQSFNNYIWDNYIGTNIEGAAPLGNQSSGLWFRDSGNNEVNINIIGGNQGHGVLESGQTSGNSYTGNAVGTNFSGRTDLGNASDGLYLVGTNVLVGGLFQQDRNFIAFNNGNGVTVDGSGPVYIRANPIYGNGVLEIDLGGNGVTPNDAGDTDSGPNDYTNFPILESVTYNSGFGTYNFKGHLDALPNKEYVIELWSSTECGVSGYGGGESRIVGLQADTDATGHLAFDFDFSTDDVVGYAFAANAHTGNTVQDPYLIVSEFSPCVEMQPAVAVDPAATNANAFALGAIRPQPSSGITRIPFSLPHTARVSLRVFDAAGREVTELLDESRDPGRHEAWWDASGAAPGVYWIRFEAKMAGSAGSHFIATKRAVIVR